MSHATHLIRHQTPLERWELVVRRPDPRLLAYVTEYQGYVETAAARAIKRREVPWPGVVLIINFGPPFRLADPRIGAPPADFHNFVAGLYDSYVITESTGLSHCLQVNFTPIGARLFFQPPMDTIANRTVHLEDVFGRDARCLDGSSCRDQGGAPRNARFALFVSSISGQGRCQAPSPSPEVLRAWDQLQLPGLTGRIGKIAS